MKKILSRLYTVMISLLLLCFAAGAMPVQAGESVLADKKAVSHFGDWNIVLPDDSWSGEYSTGLEMVSLYKAGHYKSGDPTIKIYTDDLSLEDSIRSAKAFFGSADDVTDFSMDVNGFSCVGFRQEVSSVVSDKVFYAIDERTTLRFNITVQNGSVAGLSRDDAEVRAILESTIVENGFDAPSTQADTTQDEALPRYVIDSSALEMEGQFYDVGDFSVLVPDGWAACPAYDFAKKKDSTHSIYLIKGGASQDDYGSLPSVRIDYDDEEDVLTKAASSKRYSDAYQDILVTIDGVDCTAFEGRTEMASKPVYWVYDYVYFPVTETSSLQVEVSVESSEYEGVSLLDPDVQLIVTGIEMAGTR